MIVHCQQCDCQDLFLLGVLPHASLNEHYPPGQIPPLISRKDLCLILSTTDSNNILHINMISYLYLSIWRFPVCCLYLCLQEASDFAAILPGRCLIPDSFGVPLFLPSRVFVTVIYRQLDGHVNIHNEALLAAASTKIGRGKAWRAFGGGDLGIGWWGIDQAQPSERRHKCGPLSAWRMLSCVVW